MRVSASELEQKLKKAAMKLVSASEAEYFAKETIETHLRKAPRTNPLQAAMKDLEATFAYKNEKIEYVVDLSAFISVDFHRHGPSVYLKRMHDELENRSSQNGVTVMALTNSQCMHTLHVWVQGLAKRGLVAIAIQNGGPSTVIPFNGTKGVFGTNPMAYGLPGRDGEIHCVDMATSEIPYFDLLNANEDNTPLQQRAVVDSDGEFTKNASKGLDFTHSQSDPIGNIVSMGGGYKGYYLTYLLEILTSGMIGALSSTEQSHDFVPEEHGAVLIVFNPRTMGTAAQLEDSMSSLHAAVKAQKPKTGTTIRLPGEANNQRLAKSVREIEIAEELYEKLSSWQ